jgi:hypothetical protein
MLAGCRSSQPNLMPDTTKEQYVLPPMDARYESSAYPKQAFDTPPDPGRRSFDTQTAGGMPPRGGMGGAPGMR